MRLVGTGDDMGIEGSFEIEEFCKRKIANLLGTVECSESPRDYRDWYTACGILEKDPNFVKLSVFLLIKHHFDRPTAPGDVGDEIEVASDYETFDRVCGREIWEQFRELRQNLPRPPYGNILSD
jgi:hypothetical protein